MESLQSILSESSSAVTELRGELARDAEPETTQQRDAAEPKEAKAAPKATEEDGESDGEDAIDLSPDGLQKALKSERSLRKAQRKELKEALNRLRDFEANQHQLTGHVAALHQQSQQRAEAKTPKAEQPNEWDDLLTKGPEYVRETIRQEFAERERQAQEQRAAAIHARVATQRQAMHQQREDAREIEAWFHQAASRDPELVRRFNAVAEQGGDPWDWAAKYTTAAREISQYASLDEYVEAKIKERESRQHGDAGDGAPRGTVTRLAQKTLAGTRGSGAGVTRDYSGPTPLKELFG